MTKKEYAARNIGITFDFIRQIIEHPEIIDTIPDNAELDFIDKDMPVKVKGRGGKRNIARYKVERIFEPMKEQIPTSR